MISIVCCSVNELLFKDFSANVAATIGVAYEIVCINNAQNAFSSINKAYNAGLLQARYDLVCFVHEDVAFHTPDWGVVIAGYFRDHPATGLLGVCGSRLLGRLPAPWWQQSNTCLNIIHTTDNHSSNDQYGWESDEQYAAMACVDGVFMAIRKSSGLDFDERIEGFHAYDLALSIRCKRLGLDVLAVRDLHLEHFSKGNVNKEWYQAFYHFFRLYRNELPISYGRNMSQSAITDAYLAFIRACLQYKLRAAAFYFWTQFFRIKPISKFHFEFLKSIV